jgi:hypothetical protein
MGTDKEIKPRTISCAVVIAVVAVVLFTLFVLNVGGLADVIKGWWLTTQSFVGLTETEIVSKVGEPSYRSTVLEFSPGEGYGPFPQKLDKGEEFVYINIIVGTRMFIFNFVSPETFNVYTGESVSGSEWVVLEHYSFNKNIVW